MSERIPLALNGADLDEMERRAKQIRYFSEFEEPYDRSLNKIGKPY